MSTINEPLISTTRPNHRYDQRWRTDWFLYRQTHQLARDYYKIKQGRTTELLPWLLNNTANISTLSLDSFYPALVTHFDQIDCYEYCYHENLFRDTQRKLCQNPQQITQKYDQLLVLGEQNFKYQTTAQYTQLLLKYFDLLNNKGVIIICLPMLHHCFHRLRYQPQDVLNQINLALAEKNYAISDHTILNYCYFLKINPN